MSLSHAVNYRDLGYFPKGKERRKQPTSRERLCRDLEHATAVSLSISKGNDMSSMARAAATAGETVTEGWLVARPYWAAGDLPMTDPCGRAHAKTS